MTKLELTQRLESLADELTNGIEDSAGKENSWNELRKTASDVCCELLELKWRIRDEN